MLHITRRQKPAKTNWNNNGSADFGSARSWYPPATAPAAKAAADSLRRRYLAVLACILAAWLPIEAPAAPESPDAIPQSGSLLLRLQSGYEIATRLNTDVRMIIGGLTARMTLTQEFLNDGDQWVEGVYVFPLPEGAAVDAMRIRIGDRLIEGEIREKEAAKAEYEKARAEGRRASLVRQERANLFTTQVANIGPGETVSIEIEYLDTVRFDENTFSTRFPLTLTPRYIPGAPLPDRQGSGWSDDTDQVPDASLITPPVVASSRDHRVTFEAVIDAGMALEFVASRYHPVTIDQADGRYRVHFTAGSVAMDHDVELLWRPVPEQSPRAMLFNQTVDGEPHMLVMLMPPNDDAAVVTVPPRELIFVIDTSGSMHGVSIGQAKKSLELALDGLRPVDTFNVIQFNNVTNALYSGSVPATPANLRDARNYVSRLHADGGTEMRPALEMALAGPADGERLKQIIFITDGSVGNEDALFRLIEHDLGRSRLFTVGIGSAPNGWFMQKAAEAGRGAFVTISALHEVEEKMGRLFRKLERPMVTDLQVTWPDDLAPSAYPSTVPDLYAGEPVVIKAKLEREPRPGDQLVIAGRLPSGDWGAELPLADARDAEGMASVWARAHIASLMDSLRRGSPEDEVKTAVIDTALTHRIVSRYTSLVAVDKTPARSAEATLAREQVPNLLPYGQNHSAIFGFPATATMAPALRRNGALLLALGALLLFLQVWSVRGGTARTKNDEQD